MAVLKVQGSNLYMFDGTALTKLVCVKTIDVGSDSVSKIETTCIEETSSKSYISGLSDLGEGSLTIDLDPANVSHLALINAANSSTPVTMYLLASDGTAVPTTTGSAPNITVTVPTGRSYWTFKATLTNPVPKFDADAIVGYTVTLQRSTKVTFVPKA